MGFIGGSLVRWVLKNRAFTPWYLVRYWRMVKLRLRCRGVQFKGLVFLGRHVTVTSRRGYGRVILGEWVHIGDHTSLRAHEGTLRVGDKAVFGQYDTVNCYLDIDIGAQTLIADHVHITDFDHRFDDVQTPIKDQGIVKTPVRVGSDCWIGVKASVLRGSIIGRGSVVAAHAVVRGKSDDFSVLAGVPARVVKKRQ